MITNPTNVSLNAYSYLSTVKQHSDFFTDSEIEGAQKVRKFTATSLLARHVKF